MSRPQPRDLSAIKRSMFSGALSALGVTGPGTRDAIDKAKARQFKGIVSDPSLSDKQRDEAVKHLDLVYNRALDCMPDTLREQSGPRPPAPPTPSHTLASSPVTQSAESAEVDQLLAERELFSDWLEEGADDPELEKAIEGNLERIDQRLSEISGSHGYEAGQAEERAASKDPHQILGVAKGADKATIEAAFGKQYDEAEALREDVMRSGDGPEAVKMLDDIEAHITDLDQAKEEALKDAPRHETGQAEERAASRDPHQILGVAKDADKATIEAAFGKQYDEAEALREDVMRSGDGPEAVKMLDDIEAHITDLDQAKEEALKDAPQRSREDRMTGSLPSARAQSEPSSPRMT